MSNGNGRSLRIFAGRLSRVLAERVCRRLDMPLGDAKTLVFPDGELLVKIEEDVRGRDVYVVSSTCEPVNDNLMELLIFCDCLRRASAERVTLVIPYYGYGRQDRKDEGRVPITAKLVANLITAAKADRVLTIDLHAAQIQGFFDLPVDHLPASKVFLDYFATIREELGDLCLVSPDVGNVKVAEGVANLLGGDLAIIFKRRLSGTEVRTGDLIGNVKDRTVLMFDDMVSTGGTVVKAAHAVMEHGAKQVIVAATHPVMAGMAAEKLANSPISKVVVTDTIPLAEDKRRALGDKLVELSVGNLLGDAVRRIHEDRSVSALFHEAAMKR
ncbi:MAG: ribose-phosphate pyrophosphokinase [Phycisphaerae bacterium]|nr:ribose-phosphate pyrophosphokinase [Phycisphaerae bacterium]